MVFDEWTCQDVRVDRLGGGIVLCLVRILSTSSLVSRFPMRLIVLYVFKELLALVNRRLAATLYTLYQYIHRYPPFSTLALASVCLVRISQWDDGFQVRTLTLIIVTR